MLGYWLFPTPARLRTAWSRLFDAASLVSAIGHALTATPFLMVSRLVMDVSAVLFLHSVLCSACSEKQSDLPITQLL